MKHTNLIIAVLMGASFALAAPTLAKDPIQGIAGSLGTPASLFLKTLNISLSAPGPGPTRIPMRVDGAQVKARDPSDVWCDLSGGMLLPGGKNFTTSPDKVRKNMDQLRARSDKPSTVAGGECGLGICSDNSGISWCVYNNTDSSDGYTVESWGLLADAAQATLDTCSPDETDFSGAANYNYVWFAVVGNCNM